MLAGNAIERFPRPEMGVENETIQALFRSEDRHSLIRACIRQESIEIEIQILPAGSTQISSWACGPTLQMNPASGVDHPEGSIVLQ
jgi:hypothetical protein